MLYWRIGQRIYTQVLERRRADYGEEVLPTLATQLEKDYGNSFSVKNLRRMVQFAVTFPDEPIVVSLIRQLSWTHFIAQQATERAKLQTGQRKKEAAER